MKTVSASFKLLPIAIGAGLLILAAGRANAVETAASNASPAENNVGGLEQLVVTARKREELNQTVPVAITALSAENLRANSVQTLEDLRFHAASLQISPSPFGASVPGISIRGQRQLEGLITLDPAVGIYFADVVMVRPHGTNAAMFDLQAVQVLKGPQGTLFGRNTTGGAVLIDPAKPSFKRFDGYVGTTLGNYNTTNLTGMVNAPVSDTVAIRLAAQTNKHDGYTTNLFNGGKKDDANDQSLRASITVKPTANLVSTTVYQYFHTKTDASGWRLAGVNQTGSISSPLAGGSPDVVAALNTTLAKLGGLPWHSVINDQLKGEEVTTNHLSNTTSLKLNDVTFKNIIGWHNVDSFSAFDYDGSAIKLKDTSPTGPITLFNSQNKLNVRQFSEEFQILGDALDDRLDWITGVYYFREKGDDRQESDLFGRRINDGTGNNVSKSVFAQGNYRFESLNKLSLTAGVRKTWDERSIEQRQKIQPIAATSFSCRLTDVNGPLNPCIRERSYSSSAPSWGVTLDYAATKDTMLYAARRRGYRSGGLQLRANSYVEPASFEPETVMDWELGIKSTFKLGAMPVRTNMALYSQDYRNMQRTVSVQTASNTLVSTIFSAGKAKIEGGEFELTMLPTPGLELGAFFSLTDGKYVVFTQKNGDGKNGGFDDLSGSKLSFIPKTVYGLSGRYELPLQGSLGKVALKANWYHQTEMQLTDVNNNATHPIAAPGEGIVPAYGLVDAFVDWTNVMGHGFDLRLYGKNLADKNYATGGTSVISTGFYSYTMGAPRTFGLELRYAFGGK
jgi:iron complex outermembrane receptor protein